MKTPKRQYKTNFLEWGDETYNLMSQRKKEHLNRWKRKNRVKQLKRTIARLTDESIRFREFRLGGHLKIYSPEWEAFMILSRLKTPAEGATLEEKLDHWLTLRKVCTLALDAASFAAIAYSKAKEKEKAVCPQETAENGQQAALPPTGGQQAGNEEQTTERKDDK